VITLPGQQRQSFAGWDECWSPLRSIAQNGLPPTAKAAIAWRKSLGRAG
jgi:hypothetical protein